MSHYMLTAVHILPQIEKKGRTAKSVNVGKLLAVASRSSAGTKRRHARVSVAFEHPTWSTTESYVPWVSLMSPVGTAKPEFMIAARNKPSLSPSFANSCKKTEVAPALSPHLWSSSARTPEGSDCGTYIVTLKGSPPKAEMYLLTQRRAARSDIETVSVGPEIHYKQDAYDRGGRGSRHPLPAPLYRRGSQRRSDYRGSMRTRTHWKRRRGGHTGSSERHISRVQPAR